MTDEQKRKALVEEWENAPGEGASYIAGLAYRQEQREKEAAAKLPQTPAPGK